MSRREQKILKLQKPSTGYFSSNLKTVFDKVQQNYHNF